MEVAKKLLIKEWWESFWFGRFCRWVMFKLGFSQCRYCIYCNADGVAYRGIRESILLRDGKCHWSQGLGTANLTYEDMRDYHRCPAFMSMLYNFKGYSIDRVEVKTIMSAKADISWKWLGWIVAVISLLISLIKKG